ncbi:hypothetical protein GCM10025777_16590 [Membranihabitans marinus]
MLMMGCGLHQSITDKDDHRKAIFSFVFDDLNATDTTVKNIFDEYNFKPSFALVSKKLNAETAKLYKSYYEEGISILSHSITHPKMRDSTLDVAMINREFQYSKETIEKYGIEVTGFVTPNSYLHPQYLKLAEEYYEYSFTNNNDNKFDKSVPKHSLARYGIEANISSVDHNIETIVSRIDSAIAEKELLVFYGHQMPSTYKDDEGNSRVNTEDLRNILDYLKAKSDNNECKVLSADAAVAEYYN